MALMKMEDVKWQVMITGRQQDVRKTKQQKDWKKRSHDRTKMDSKNFYCLAGMTGCKMELATTTYLYIYIYIPSHLSESTSPAQLQ